MKSFDVTVQQTVSKIVNVEANSEEEARDIVEQIMCEDENFWNEDSYGYDFIEDWFIEEA